MPRRPTDTDAEKALFLENLSARRARRLALAQSDIDRDGQELGEEAGFNDPFDPVEPGVQASTSAEALQSMAALKRDPDGDSLETAEEVGLSDPWDSREVTDPQLQGLDAEETQGLELMSRDLDGDGADLTEEVGLTDPFNDEIRSGTRGETKQDLDDMGL